MPRSAPPLTGGDALRLGALAGFAALLLAPLRHYVGPMPKVNAAKLEHDSFPLSTYPMFSADRRGRIVIPHVIGLTADGERIVPHYRHYGAGGLNQVRKQIARDVREGRAVEAAQRYADALAADRERRTGARADAQAPRAPERSAAAARRTREAAIERVAVVRARYVFDAWFAGDRAPQAESVHAECVVGGTAAAGPGDPLPRLPRKDQR